MNRLKKVIYNITRNYAKKELTFNLGKVVEDEDKLTCYVDANKLRKELKKARILYLITGRWEQELAKKYKLNKHICYVIDGLESKKYNCINISGTNCDVIIKNSKLDGLVINIDGKCILDNINICTYYFLSISANELIIKNIKKGQMSSYNGTDLDVGFHANDRIDVIDSNIGVRMDDISFFTNSLNFVNSKIVGGIIECDSNKINMDKNSSLTAHDALYLKTDNFNSINVNAPTIILNEQEIINEKNQVVLKNLSNKLVAKKRLELINILKEIKAECENLNLEKVLEYQEKLNEEPIRKVLKKTK